MRRSAPIWITGVGTINPLGTCLTSTMAGLLAGRSGVRSLRHGREGKDGFEPWIGGCNEHIPAPPGFPAGEFATLPRREQLLLGCAVQALRDAGRWDDRDTLRIGLVLGY